VISRESFPAINATLNGTAAVLLAAGYLLIRQRRVTAHLACMAAALVVSTLFLGCYLYYHFHAGRTTFTGQGWIRPVYFTVLGTHTVLAVTVVPLALVTLVLSIRRRFDRHVRVARWTLPIWFYVSVTGVLIYWLLYHAYAPG
jgi:uncharacterized membrane protein YozB (DUF420 family)